MDIGKRRLGRARRWAVAAAVLLAQSLSAAQEPGPLLIGQTSDFSGPAAPGVRENVAGAMLYFDHVNAGGGIAGRKIKLVSLDDRLDANQAVHNARSLIVGEQVLALFLNRGTANTQALMPLLAEHGVPLVAPSTGAMALHRPVHPWVFNVRPTYQREVERAVLHLASVGLTRIALVAADDSFGSDCAEGALTGFKKAGLAPVVDRRYSRSAPRFAEIAARVAGHDAQAVLFHGAAQEVADGTRALRAAGSRAQVVTQSTNASSGFVRLMGPWAQGTIVTQVFPSERTLSSAFVRQAAAMSKLKGGPELTPAVMEGFAAAKVLVEGLRRAGGRPTRQSLRQALESMRHFDLGGLELGYGPDDHTGLDHADLSIIGPDGRFQR